jgi:hypothetical protein
MNNTRASGQAENRPLARFSLCARFGSIADYPSYVYSMPGADIGEFRHCGTLLAPARDFECMCCNCEGTQWTCSTNM